MRSLRRGRVTAAGLVVVAACVLAGCGSGGDGGSNGPSASPSPSMAHGSPPTASLPGSPSAGPASPTQSESGDIDRDQAGQIATDKYGGTVISVESDHYHGHDVWEVEVRDSDQGRIEVKVDKGSGKIRGMERD